MYMFVCSHDYLFVFFASVPAQLLTCLFVVCVCARDCSFTCVFVLVYWTACLLAYVFTVTWLHVYLSSCVRLNLCNRWFDFLGCLFTWLFLYWSTCLLVNVFTCILEYFKMFLGQGRSKSEIDQSSAETRQFVAAGVEWLYILSHQDLLDSLFEAVQSKIYDLGRFVIEYRLFHWLVAQNCSKGIRPKARQVRAEAARSVPAAMPLGDQDKLRKSFLEDTRLVRKWIESLRQRWGGQAWHTACRGSARAECLEREGGLEYLALLFCMWICSPL